MFNAIQKKVEELDPVLQKMLDTGFFQKEVVILGTTATMHVLVKDEIIEVNQRASQSNDILTRQHLINVWALAHATSVIAGVAMKDPEHSFKVFSLMTEPMFNYWFDEYQSLIPQTDEQLKKLVATAKK